MTKDEALNLALEALTYIYTETTADEDELIDQAITAIKEALANVATEDTSKERVDEIQKQRHEANVQKFLGAPQPEQEPVAWLHWLHGPVQVFLNKDQAMMELDRINREYPVDKDARQMKPLYTTPPQLEPLTQDETMEIANQTAGQYWMDETHIQRFRAAVEAAHGIKE